MNATALVASSHIDGVRTSADDHHEAIPVLDPCDGSVLGNLIASTGDEVTAAVDAAQRTFVAGTWSQQPVRHRAEVLTRAAALVEERADELAQLESATTGIPITQTRTRQVPGVAALLSSFASSASQESDPISRPGSFEARIQYRPAGVCALITPWNSPVFLSALKVSAALAYGNSIVLKPSEFTPFGPLHLVDLLEEAGVPAGVINVVNGPGAQVGALLTDQPAVRRISFTGGNVAGTKVLVAGARRVVPVTAELGGKAPIVVLRSASVEAAIEGIMATAFSTNGQQCYAGTRLIVHREIASELVPAVVGRTADLVVGDPLEADTQVGPLAHRSHRDRVLGMVERARSQGAEVMVGGRLRDPEASGNHFMPAVVRLDGTDVDIWRDEVFGPVLTLIEVDSDEEALRLANDTRFGLAAYGWADDPSEIQLLSDGLSAGQVWINSPLRADPRLPFGGIGESGVGREGETAARDFYTDPVAVAVAQP